MKIVELISNPVGNWKVPNDFVFGKELLVAFSRKNGHAYLIAGKYEVHGHFIFKKTFSRTFCDKSCEPLVYIRFRNINDLDIKTIENYIKRTEGIRESSCINYCLISIFSTLGILIESNGKNIVNLEDCLMGVLNNGVTRYGRPQDVEIYNTSDMQLSKVIEHFNFLENRFKWTHIISRVLGKILFFHRKEHRDYYKAIYNEQTNIFRALVE